MILTLLVGVSSVLLTSCASPLLTIQNDAARQALRWYNAERVCEEAGPVNGAARHECVMAYVEGRPVTLPGVHVAGD